MAWIPAGSRTVMIYDLGGGTLDVSVVRIEGEVTEVLASHGNNHLGGDDFDQKLVDHPAGGVPQAARHRPARQAIPAAYARLWWAAEAAKKQLSFEPYAGVARSRLIVVDGRPLHLDVEISREKYEGMIRPLLEQTLDSAIQGACPMPGWCPGGWTRSCWWAAPRARRWW